jgi:hypothetical protein
VKKDLNLLRDMLTGDNSQLVQEMKHTYMTAMTGAMSIITTGMVEYLYYKNVFGSDKEKTIKFMEAMLDRGHVEIAKAIVDSISGSEDYELFKEEMGAIISDVKKAMEESLEEIKRGLRESLDGAILQFTESNDIGDTGKSSD